MNDDILKKHEHEWEIFLAMHDMELDKFIADEIAERKKYGMIEDHLPEETRNKIQRDRWAWRDEWGPRGRQALALDDKQRRELVEHDTETMVRNMYLAAQMDIVLKQEIFDAVTEKKVVFNYYEQKGEPVPYATQQRFAKRLLELGDRYRGRPYIERRTLKDDDLKDDQGSWKDLMQQHTIIQEYYGTFENTPTASCDQMAKDEQNFYAEVAKYERFFEAELQAERERNQRGRHRPKPG